MILTWHSLETRYEDSQKYVDKKMEEPSNILTINLIRNVKIQIKKKASSKLMYPDCNFIGHMSLGIHSLRIFHLIATSITKYYAVTVCNNS